MLSPQETILRLVMAAVLGGLVGLERERLEWVAGWRTHMLVCLGSALVVIVSAYGFNTVISPYRIVLDPSRVAAQVVSGIGFLGAGTILFLRHEVIRGLTTAASLWTVAAVGLGVGSGLYLAAVFTTVLVVVILALMKPVEKRLFHRRQTRHLTISIDHQRASLLAIQSALEATDLMVKQITLKRGDKVEEDYVTIDLMNSASKEAMATVAERVRKLEGVQSITWGCGREPN